MELTENEKEVLERVREELKELPDPCFATEILVDDLIVIMTIVDRAVEVAGGK